jgi:hypothetical protein
MLKTGFVGILTDAVYDAISMHPGFDLTGVYPATDPLSVKNITGKNLPRLSSDTLFAYNEVLIIQQAGAGTLDIMTEALRHSRHIMLLDIGGLCSVPLTRLLKLHREAETVIKILHTERVNPALKACLPLLNHPCLFDVKLMIAENHDDTSPGPGVGALSRMLDVLLFLCPLNFQKIQSLRHPFSGLINARVEFDNGSVANITSSEITEKEDFCIDIYQSNMLLKVDILRHKLLCIEKCAKGNTLKSHAKQYENTAGQTFRDELDVFYNSIMSKNATAKDLFELSRLLDLSHKITERSWSSVSAYHPVSTNTLAGCIIKSK